MSKHLEILEHCLRYSWLGKPQKLPSGLSPGFVPLRFFSEILITTGCVRTLVQLLTHQATLCSAACLGLQKTPGRLKKRAQQSGSAWWVTSCAVGVNSSDYRKAVRSKGWHFLPSLTTPKRLETQNWVSLRRGLHAYCGKQVMAQGGGERH